MKVSNMPQTIPNLALPGHTYGDPFKTSFNKAHILDIKQGIQTETTNHLKEDINYELCNELKEGEPQKLTGIPPREEKVKESIPRLSPQWLKYDKQVLSFSCYFLEPVYEKR